MHCSERILIVDDEEAVRTELAKFVAKQGFQRDCAKSGEEALALIERNDYGFVIADVTMPGTDGLKLLQELKALKKDIPVAVVTDLGTLDLAIEAVRCGAVDFVEKPFDFERVSQLLFKVFERQKREISYQEALSVLTSGTFVLPNEMTVHESAARIATKRLEGTPFHDGVYLALVEALANAIEHGNLEITQQEKIDATTEGCFDDLKRSRLADPALGNRKVFLRFETSGEAVCFVVRDEGKGFNYRELPDPTRSENIFNASGQGILLIQCYMDQVFWNEPGNEITLLKKLTRASSE